MATLPSLNELLEGIPPEKLDAPCKDVHLVEIALSIPDWEVIAPFLGISMAEAEDINRDEGKKVPQRISMLRKWKEKCGRRATYRRLARTFLQLERKDLVDAICGVLVDSNSSSSDDDPMIHQSILHQYAGHLRCRYPKVFPGFAQWPPPPTHTFFNLAMIKRSRTQLGPIDEEYIRLTQQGNVDDIMQNKIEIQVRDIFLHHGAQQIIVLVEGAPGAGKSTLAWYVCDQWGSGNLFGEFILVVFVQLHSPAVQSATSIADLLPRSVSGEEREVLSRLETRCGNGVLFVLDGWDEYSGGLTRDSICRRLICTPEDLNMQESTLLVTSRPVASGELQLYCTTRIEIVGFSPKEVNEYFKDSLGVLHQGEHQAEVLQECLKVRPIIQASCYLPLNAAIVVHLFITEGNTLPTTLHGLFTSLVLNSIVRHLKKTGQVEGKRSPKITSFESLPTELQPHFNTICALAYHGIMTNKASFSDEELHSFNLSTASSAPLLSLIQGWSTFKSSWEDFSYSFFHRSVQELLAAFHISKQSHTQQVEVFRKIFGQPRFAAVLNFYAAFTKFQVTGIREFIREVIQQNQGLSKKEVLSVEFSSSSLHPTRAQQTILDCLYEAQDPPLCQYIATVMKGNLTVDYAVSPFHCMVLGYFLLCLCLTPGGGKLYIQLDNPGLDEYKCSYLINELKKCSHGQLSLSLFETGSIQNIDVLVPMLQKSCSHCITDLTLGVSLKEDTMSVERSDVDSKEWVVTGLLTDRDLLGRLDKLREKTVTLKEAAANSDDLGPPPEIIRQIVLHELQKALKHGYIPSDITTCLAWGAPGVGKTTLRFYLFHQLPPLTRVSTACIEPAQRALLASSPDGGEVTCQAVDTQRFKTIIADEVSGGVEVMQEAGESKAALPSSHHGDLTMSQVVDDRKDSPLQVKTDTTTASSSGRSSIPPIEHDTEDSPTHGKAYHPATVAEGDLPSSFSPVPVSESVSPSLEISTSEPTVIEEQSVELLPVMSEVLDLLETSTKSKPVQGVHWVHFIDSGGQGQFHHLISTLARNITLLLVVIKLSEKLSDKPNAEYYDHDGKCHQLGGFTLTNKQLLLKIAQFSFYHEPKFPFLYAEVTPTRPKVMVVGTFMDQENKEESIKTKNELLKEALAPLQEQQLLIPRSDHEIIFPVNATLAGQDGEGIVASELRSAFQKHAPRLQIKLPSRWKLLELEIRKLGQKFVATAECWKIAKDIDGFETEDTLEAALLYLHETNFFLYDPKILPGVVIVDPQAIIGVVTQLIEQSTKLHEAAEWDVTSEKELRLRDQAIFTIETIASLNIPFEGGLLSIEDVVTDSARS